MQVGDLLQVLPGSIEMVCAAPKGRVQAHNPYRGEEVGLRFDTCSQRSRCPPEYLAKARSTRGIIPTYKNQFTFLVNIAILELVNTFTWRGYSR